MRAKAPHISFLQEAYKGLRAIATVARRAEMRAARRQRDGRSAAARPRCSGPSSSACAAARRPKPVALDEAESKNVLRAYGIATPAETLVTSPAAALKAADRIGYPVVLKAVAPTLLHKSDVGGVALNLATPAAADRTPTTR